MARATSFVLATAALLTFPFRTSGQELVHKGMLVSQILARTRMEVFERGDLMHVTVRQSAQSHGFTVSVHAEYIDASGKWQQVPPPKSMIGVVYTSKTFGGLRDYVDVQPTSETTERNVALFMPFDGFSLPEGKDYTVRYVLRTWTLSDKVLSTLALKPYRVHVGRDSDGILVSILDVKPCSALVGSGSKDAGVARPAGIIRLFDTTRGEWECPTGSGQSTGSGQTTGAEDVQPPRERT
jgi:hypothetical protein